MTLSIRTGIASALSLAFAGAAGATTLANLSTDQLTDASDLVVRGKVASVETDLNDHGKVVTVAQVQVSETLKGIADAGDWLRVETPGGIYGDLVVDAHGAPRYSAGEDVLLFLVEYGGGDAWSTVGLSLGKYTIKQDPTTGKDMLVRFTLPIAQTYDARFVPNPPKGQRVMLADMDAKVRARVALGWDGEPIPGVSNDHLREINRLQPGVR